MRILVHEYVTGGGLAGRAVPVSLAREGSAMLAALIVDLAAIGCHEIVATSDPRFPPRAPPGVSVVALGAGDTRVLDALVAAADAVWLVAPETDRCLERLAARVERQGSGLLGPGVQAIRRASDKGSLPRRLARLGVPHPKTRVLRPDVDWKAAAREFAGPVVVKPARGAGCIGVRLARSARELRWAMRSVRSIAGRETLLLQEYVPGLAASVSVLTDGQRVIPLAVSAQLVRTTPSFRYAGGTTPADHPLADRAVEAALRTCQGLPGLRGYVGVDLVLSDSEAVVIEVNPRLTTSYLGVRAAIDENVAALALAACTGNLPEPPRARRRIWFTAAGRVRSTPRGRSGVWLRDTYEPTLAPRSLALPVPSSE